MKGYQASEKRRYEEAIVIENNMLEVTKLMD
jgi:hypothetical protein